MISTYRLVQCHFSWLTLISISSNRLPTSTPGYFNDEGGERMHVVHLAVYLYLQWFMVWQLYRPVHTISPQCSHDQNPSEKMNVDKYSVRNRQSSQGAFSPQIIAKISLVCVPLQIALHLDRWLDAV